jgi:hypothetical protein
MSRFKTIASYRDLPLAELAKAKLESEGIYCHLLNKHHIGINWLYSQALGGVEVQVPTEDAEKANKILLKDESIYLDNEELEFFEASECDLCVYCGSPNLELIKYSRLSAVLIMITQLPIIFWGTRYRCKDCGKKMKIKSK